MNIGKTGVGGTNLHGLVFEMIAKYNSMIMNNLLFAIHCFSIR